MAKGGGCGAKTGLYFIDLCNGNPKLTGAARCIKARYNSGITNRSADNSGVLCVDTKLNTANSESQGVSPDLFYGCRAVITPDRMTKRQNGRRFKECGEPAFCLNTQDRHGVYICSCISCEHSLPVKSNADAPAPCGYGRIRRLTPRECWRLQGFSDDLYDKAAAVTSEAQLYKQAGNGVTIPVVYAVGKRITEIQNTVRTITPP